MEVGKRIVFSQEQNVGSIEVKNLQKREEEHEKLNTNEKKYIEIQKTNTII